MPRFRRLCLPAFLGLLVAAAPADAGRRRQPAEPPASAPVLAPQPPPSVPVPVIEQAPPPALIPAPPPGPVVPPAVVLAPVPVPALTLQQFAAAFRPAPGKYEVVLLHPRNGRPVPVCFTLPPGCPKVRVGKREIEFDYGKHEVEIRFTLFGKVKVDYD